jgi:hypothetical protein
MEGGQGDHGRYGALQRAPEPQAQAMSLNS